MWYPFRLIDDGTLDTVVRCRHGRTFRYEAELAAAYRDEDGRLNFDRFRREVVSPDCYEQCLPDTEEDEARRRGVR
jgi:hypothetical protein